MKYLVLMLVVGVVVWMLTARGRKRDSGAGGSARREPPHAGPTAMVACAHCGLHLPASDAVLDGSRVYCGDKHRLLGPKNHP